jgi:hypothetical protein
MDTINITIFFISGEGTGISSQLALVHLNVGRWAI